MRKQEKLAEAKKRMTVLRDKFYENDAALEKYRQGKMTVCLSCGEVCDIDDPEFGFGFTSVIHDFEMQFPGYMVYHCIEMGGPLLAVLYVGPNKEEWEEERFDKDGNVTCYVYNALFPELSEPGQIQIMYLD